METNKPKRELERIARKAAIKRPSRTDQDEDAFGQAVVYGQFLKQTGNTDWKTIATFAKRKTEKRTIDN